MSTRAVLIFNPRAGRWRTSHRVEVIGKVLEAGGYSLKLLPTSKPGHATELGRQAAASGFDVAFAYGGDGTIREVAAGLLGSGVALGPIPGGTVNVVSLAIGLPLDPVRAAAAFSNATTIEIDVGLCGEEPFLMLTSAGLDAHIMYNLHPGLKRRLGKVAVAWAGLQRWTSYDYPRIHLVADGHPLEATFAAICNLPFYAGKWKLAPGASATDRALDLVVFRGTGRWKTLAFARDLALGRHIRRPDVEMSRVERVEILGPAEVPIQIDGDGMAIKLPVALTISPKRLTLLAPSTAAP
ncbi:MAG: diacylglycerol kinase family lipid kinase [Acidobacteriota bacterium]|jgi:diacylglycerol kinase (ATP)